MALGFGDHRGSDLAAADGGLPAFGAGGVRCGTTVVVVDRGACRRGSHVVESWMSRTYGVLTLRRRALYVGAAMGAQPR